MTSKNILYSARVAPLLVINKSTFFLINRNVVLPGSASRLFLPPSVQFSFLPGGKNWARPKKWPQVAENRGHIYATCNYHHRPLP